jgi:hypothetical protein
MFRENLTEILWVFHLRPSDEFMRDVIFGILQTQDGILFKKVSIEGSPRFVSIQSIRHVTYIVMINCLLSRKVVREPIWCGLYISPGFVNSRIGDVDIYFIS